MSAPTRIAKMKKQAEVQGLDEFLVTELAPAYVKRPPTEFLPKVFSSADSERFLRRIWEKDSIEHFESFYILVLNRANQITGWRQISKGGVAGTVADPKIIFQFALLGNASGIILAHNHPSGNMMASEADKHVTRKIVEAGKVLEIQVLDHIILGPERYMSFSDEGMM